jgi:hypothetical protein
VGSHLTVIDTSDFSDLMSLYSSSDEGWELKGERREGGRERRARIVEGFFLAQEKIDAALNSVNPIFKHIDFLPLRCRARFMQREGGGGGLGAQIIMAPRGAALEESYSLLNRATYKES